MGGLRNFLIAFMVLAIVACGKKGTSDAGADSASLSDVGSAKYASTVPMTDWNILFYNPSQTTAAVEKLGFGSLEYKEFPSPPPAFMGTVSAEISETDNGLPNTVDILTYGKNSNVLDEIDFVLGIYSPSLAKQSKSKFSKIITSFIRSNHLAGIELVNRALASEKPDNIMVGNAILTVRLNDHGKPGSDKRDLELIFHRPGVVLQEN